jgi:hypothetical protein
LPEMRNIPSTIFFLAVLLIGSAYWISNHAITPKVKLDQAILFRPDGDFTYLPQVSALARLEWGEASVRESAGRGVRSFPIVAVILHATLVRLLGDAGFVFADILAFLLYGWALRYFLRNAGMTQGVAEGLTLLVVSGALGSIVFEAAKYTGNIPLPFWYPRFPRPLITEFFVVAFLSLACRFINDQATRNKIWGWVLMGLLGACLVQSDIYQAMNMALVGILLVCYLLARDWKIVLRGVAIAGGAAAIVCTPFIYQRLHESPEVLRRWGMFPSGHKLLLFGGPRLFALAFLTLLVEVLLCYRVRGLASMYAKTAALITGTAVVTSLLSGPLWLLVLGKGIQVYHHVLSASLLIGYAMLVCAGWLLQDVLQWLDQALSTQETLALRIKSLAYAMAILISLAVAAGAAHASVVGRRPLPPSMSLENTTEPGYESSFTELHAELMRPEYKQAQVLATFDIQLADWWEYQHRYLYLPDHFNTTVSDREMEDRFYGFLRLMETTPEEFNQLLDIRYFLMRMTGGKYQANAKYTPWPIEDYSPDAQARIVRRTITESWNLELPLSERKRLLESYAHFDLSAQPYRELDVIVLAKRDPRQFLHPERGKLMLKWANDTFEIWVPRSEAATRHKLDVSIGRQFDSD